jgi:hypothetical protein
MHTDASPFCWTRIGDDASQPLDVILRRKDHERVHGNDVWWGVGESNLQGRMDRLLDHYAHAQSLPPVVFTPQLTPGKAGDGNVLVWRKYYAPGESAEAILIPPHALVLSSAKTGKGKHKTRYFALVCKFVEPLTKPVGGDFYRNQHYNWRGGQTVGPQQITAVVHEYRPAPKPAGQPYRIHMRALLAKFVILADPRPISESDRWITDDAGNRSFSAKEWCDLVRQIRDGR